MWIKDESGKTFSSIYVALSDEVKPANVAVQSREFNVGGNVTEARAISKTAGTPADIVKAAAYPSTCTNALTCNQPTNTTDHSAVSTPFRSPVFGVRRNTPSDRVRPCTHAIATVHDSDSQFEKANTARFTKAIEDIVRRFPDQWLWVHRRWKTRPEDQPPIY